MFCGFCGYSPAARRGQLHLFGGALLTTLALCLFLRPACAYDTDGQLWTQFTLNGKFKNGIRIYAEVQARQGQDYHQFSQFILRPAVGYQVTRKMSLWIGYGWTPTFIPNFKNEHRIYEQALYEDTVGRIGLTNRIRLEEREIEGAGGTSVRLRHQIRLSVPLDSRRRWSAVGSNEIYYNLNGVLRGPQAGVDQDRVYAGAAYSINRHTRVDAGYVAAFINRPKSLPDRRLDVLMLGVNYTL